MYNLFEIRALSLFNRPDILPVMGVNSPRELYICVLVCVLKGGGASLPWERVMTVALIENHYKQLKQIKEKMPILKSSEAKDEQYISVPFNKSFFVLSLSASQHDTSHKNVRTWR